MEEVKVQTGQRGRRRKMDVLGLESFRRVLPPGLQEYWVGVLAAVVAFNVMLVLGEFCSLLYLRL